MSKRTAIIALLALVALLPLHGDVRPTRADALPPFEVTLSDYRAGKHADVTITRRLTAADEYPDFLVIKSPPGWTVNDGNNIPNGATVAAGFGSVIYLGNPTPYTVTVTNMTPCGSKACWHIGYSAFAALTTTVQGSDTAGHYVIINPLLLGLDTPTEFTLTVLGQTAGSTPSLANPVVPGNYTWEIEDHSFSGAVSSRQVVVTILPPPVGGMVELLSGSRGGSLGRLPEAVAALLLLGVGGMYVVKARRE